MQDTNRTHPSIQHTPPAQQSTRVGAAWSDSVIGPSLTQLPKHRPIPASRHGHTDTEPAVSDNPSATHQRRTTTTPNLAGGAYSSFAASYCSTPFRAASCPPEREFNNKHPANMNAHRKSQKQGTRQRTSTVLRDATTLCSRFRSSVNMRNFSRAPPVSFDSCWYLSFALLWSVRHTRRSLVTLPAQPRQITLAMGARTSLELSSAISPCCVAMVARICSASYCAFAKRLSSRSRNCSTMPKTMERRREGKQVNSKTWVVPHLCHC